MRRPRARRSGHRQDRPAAGVLSRATRSAARAVGRLRCAVHAAAARARSTTSRARRRASCSPPSMPRPAATRSSRAALDELEHGPPALVVFEDCHWADEATFDLLKFLGRRMQRTRSMLVMTYRTDEVGSRHPCRFVIGDLPCSIVRRLPLQPLSEVAVAKLAKQAGRSSQGLYNTTGGNPFFVTEVLATGSESIPSNARDVVLARLAKLPPGARAHRRAREHRARQGRGLAARAGGRARRSEHRELSEHRHGARRGRARWRSVTISPGVRWKTRCRRHSSRACTPRVLAILGKRPGIAPARLAHHADGARNALEVLRFAPAAAAHAAAVGAHREAVSHYQAALRYADRPSAGGSRTAARTGLVRVLSDRSGAACDRCAARGAGNLARAGCAATGRRRVALVVAAELARRSSRRRGRIRCSSGRGARVAAAGSGARDGVQQSRAARHAGRGRRFGRAVGAAHAAARGAGAATTRSTATPSTISAPRGSSQASTRAGTI